MRPAAALALILSATAAGASTQAPPVAERSAISQYVRARAADAAGRSHVAAEGYAAALAASPGDAVLAVRAYRQAVVTGDQTLALRAARVLDTADALPPDGTLLLMAEAVRARDWRGAGAFVDRIEREQAFAFLSPVLRAWIALGDDARDPIARLDAGTAGGALGAGYVTEHRALLLLATGKRKDGLAAIQALNPSTGGRGARLRIAAAAALQKRDREAALGLLTGADPVTRAARAMVEGGTRLPGAILTPAEGIAELLVRVAVDINRERVTPLPLALVRSATLLAPANAEAWLVTSELLSATDHHDTALAVLDNVPATDPFAEAARVAKVALLVRSGEQAAALAEAERVAAAPGATSADWARVGELRAGQARYAEAAAAFDRALALEPEGSDTRWSLYLLKGSALEQGDNWAEALASLKEAVKLAPDQPLALNHLGYSQLERRENLAEAEKLIARASELRPEDASIADSLGWAYYVRGDVGRAIPMLERAAAGQPAETVINEHLGDAYWSAGRRYEARFAWRAALVYAEADDSKRIASKLDHGLTKELAAR